MRKILKNTFSVSFAALLSRILGVFRDILIAAMFGANLYSDIFFLVFRVPDFLRKIFSEGVLSSSFVPVFSKILVTQGEKKAFEMANSAFFFISLCTTIITIAGIIFIPFVVGVISPGVASGTSELNLMILLSRIMMPYFVMISLLAVCMGVLNSVKSFKTSAFAPVVFNMVFIFCALNICDFFNPPIIGLAIGVTLGGIAQIALQIPMLIHKKVFPIKKIVIIHPAVLEFISKICPAIIGASTFHINLLVATFLASFLHTGSITNLYFADRLVQLPMALISASVAIVFLPEFSKDAALKDRQNSSKSLLKALKFTIFIMIPAMAGLIALREPIVKLLFFHGAFDLMAVKNTSTCLLYLTSGLGAYSGTRIIVSYFYAVSDMKTPLIAGVLTIILNFILSMIFIKWFGFTGLPIAISLSGMINFLILLIRLHAIVSFSVKDIVFSTCRAVFISGIMYFIIKILILQLNAILGYEISVLLNVAISVFMGILTYFGINLIINSPEIKMIRAGIFKNRNITGY